MRRIRTAKALGQRHDFFYFKNWTEGRIARVGFAIAIPAIAGLWLLVAAVGGDNVPYSAGHLASVHAVIGKNCQACHEPETTAGGLIKVGFRKHVSDSACLNCHQAPKHQAMKETFTPECSSCHVEHVGSPHLERTADMTCTQCHSDLKVKTGEVRYVKVIDGFNENHPEFAVLRDNFKDPGTIKLNHAVHMKKTGVVDGNGREVQLQCSDCHRTPAAANNAEWKYGELKQTAMESHDSTAAEHSDSGHMMHQPQAVPHHTEPGEGRALMEPITYAKNCAQCHTMQFDQHFTESVPHDKPEIVHAYIVKRLTEYVAKHPEVVREPIAAGATDTTGHWVRRYMKETSGVVAHSPTEWVKLRTEQSEQLLWRKTCYQCHSMQQSTEPTGLPVVAEPQIKVQWLANSTFSHYAHTGFSCESCHTKTLASTETSDVLIPSVKTCQECHKGKATTAYGVAENGCFLCHQYHDWKEPRGPMNPNKNIDDLLRGANAPAKSATPLASAFFAR